MYSQRPPPNLPTAPVTSPVVTPGLSRQVSGRPPGGGARRNCSAADFYSSSADSIGLLLSEFETAVGQ